MHVKKIVDTHFKPVPSAPNQKTAHYKCEFCNQSYARHVSRMANHLANSCRGSPDTLKQSLKQILDEKVKKTNKKRKYSLVSNDNSSESDSNSHISTVSSCNSHVSKISETGSGSNVQSKNNVLSNFCDTMSLRDQQHAKCLLATAIYASGTPLNITENEHWQVLFKFLRPSFELPSRHMISNTLLKTIYELIQAEVNRLVESANTIGVQCDGWSNIRQEGIINFIITTPKPVFYKTIPTLCNAQTGDFYAKELSTVIDTIGPAKVFAICTDNAKSMIAAHKILLEKYKGMVCYGCVAHILNLLVKDIASLSSVKPLVNLAKSIVREVKGGHVLSATFADIQKKDEAITKITLKNPAITRFGSITTCFESLLCNKHNLQSLVIEPNVQKYLTQPTKTTILDETFWMKLTTISSLLKPVVQWITKLESDTPQMSYVHTAFHEIRNHFLHELEGSFLPLSPIEISQVHKLLESRMKMAVKPIHLAANILDPLLKGTDLDDNEEIAGSNFIFNIAERFGCSKDEILVELAEYKIKEGFFNAEYVQVSAKSLPALNWWKAMCGRTNLSKIAIAILNCSSTSAATERSFSTYGRIHSTTRNRLTIERAGMITFIAHNIKLLDSEKLKNIMKHVDLRMKVGESEKDDNYSSEESEHEMGEDR